LPPKKSSQNFHRSESIQDPHFACFFRRAGSQALRQARCPPLLPQNLQT
jgi:hypothetical protein